MRPRRSRSAASRRSMKITSGCPTSIIASLALTAQPRRAISSWASPTFMFAGTATSIILGLGSLRLFISSADEYAELMNNLKLPNPKMMDVAVPANMKVGLAQDEIARRGWAVNAREAMMLVGQPDVIFIDLREAAERERRGLIAGSVHAPYPELRANIAPGGMLHALGTTSGKRLLFYCAFGERSAM